MALVVAILSHGRQDLCQCHGCWESGNPRSQGLNSHGIDLFPEGLYIYIYFLPFNVYATAFLHTGTMLLHCIHYLLNFVAVWCWCRQSHDLSSGKWRPSCLSLNVLKDMNPQISDYKTATKQCTTKLYAYFMGCTVHWQGKLDNSTLIHVKINYSLTVMRDFWCQHADKREFDEP